MQEDLIKDSGIKIFKDKDEHELNSDIVASSSQEETKKIERV
jgi:hypothetical protein